MTNITYKIFNSNAILIGTIDRYLDYKEKITINGKEYMVSEFIEDSIIQVITVDRFDYEGNQLFVGDIVELEGYFYKIGDLCSEFDKEYVTYLNLDGTKSETNYACYCSKLTYEHYKKLKSNYLTFLNELEEAYKLIQVETQKN